jgi:hypothetical protein
VKYYSRVTFSWKWTLVNIGVSVMGHIIFVTVLYSEPIQKLGIWEQPQRLHSYFLNNAYKPFCLPTSIIGMLLTLLVLYLDSCRSVMCCTCCPPAPLQIGVLVLDDAMVEYVEVRDSRGREEIITKTEWRARERSESALQPDPAEVCFGSTRESAGSGLLCTGISDVESVL